MKLISKKVQSQYEENPYPRWSNIKNSIINSAPRDYSTTIRAEILPNNYEDFSGSKKQILIAGCGTGQHAIVVALRARNSIVTALDLSLSSIAYGKRKADEMGVKNIDWVHGDILNIDKMNKKFDYIESVGVLHHMENPQDGFDSLNKNLKKSGLIKLGLYSKYAKSNYSDAKDYVEKNNLKYSKDNLHKIRNHIKESTSEGSLHIKKYVNDFYTTSEFRDMLLHEQEIFFTLPEVENLFKNDFKFLGFIKQPRLSDFYRKNFPEDIKQINLKNWNKLEIKNTVLFTQMYQFWIQKK